MNSQQFRDLSQGHDLFLSFLIYRRFVIIFLLMHSVYAPYSDPLAGQSRQAQEFLGFVWFPSTEAWRTFGSLANGGGFAKLKISRSHPPFTQ
jgi:hypothetical protein